MHILNSNQYCENARVKDVQLKIVFSEWWWCHKMSVSQNSSKDWRRKEFLRNVISSLFTMNKWSHGHLLTEVFKPEISLIHVCAKKIVMSLCLDEYIHFYDGEKVHVLKRSAVLFWACPLEISLCQELAVRIQALPIFGWCLNLFPFLVSCHSPLSR